MVNTKKARENLLTFFKGLVIGAVMLVPGMSGGSTAILLGIYDDMIFAVNGITKKSFKGLPFLLFAATGGAIGLVLFSKPIHYLMLRFELPTLYFFMGAILGSIPLMIKESKIASFRLTDLVFIVLGVALVLVLQLIPQDAMRVDTTMNFSTWIILFAVGIFIAIALILPGISTSAFLLALGLYEPMTEAISSLNIWFLLPIALGAVIGVLTTTRLLEFLMKKFPRVTYLVILGFLLGSIYEIFPLVLPSLPVLFLSILLLAAGFFLVYKLSQLDLNGHKENDTPIE